MSAAFAVLAAACATPLPTASSGHLVIQTPDTVLASQIESEGPGLEATLHNPSSRDFYARIGDAYNAANEQDRLWTAENSEAVVEAKDAHGAWIPMRQGVLEEGTKYVLIKSGKTYRLVSNVYPSSYRGQARIRMRYSNLPSASGKTFVDYSNVFVIK